MRLQIVKEAWKWTNIYTFLFFFVRFASLSSPAAGFAVGYVKTRRGGGDEPCWLITRPSASRGQCLFPSFLHKHSWFIEPAGQTVRGHDLVSRCMHIRCCRSNRQARANLVHLVNCIYSCSPCRSLSLLMSVRYTVHWDVVFSMCAWVREFYGLWPEQSISSIW